MTDNELFEKWKGLIVKSVRSQLADIDLLSEHFPAAGARAKAKFINVLVQLTLEADYPPKM